MCSGHPAICILLVIPCTVCSLLVIPCTVCSLLVIPCTVCSLLVIPCTVCSLLVIPVLSAVSGHLRYCVRSLWSSPVVRPQSLVISCTVSAVSWSSPVLCPQSLVIPCTVSAVSGHLLYCVRSLWSSP
ncbi:unnamed protein product, partial [Staurois parvus]